MTIARAWYCDAADCERHTGAILSRPQGFIVVSDPPAKRMHFCSWDCVLKYAAAQEPTEVISWHQPEDDD